VTALLIIGLVSASVAANVLLIARVLRLRQQLVDVRQDGQDWRSAYRDVQQLCERRDAAMMQLQLPRVELCNQATELLRKWKDDEGVAAKDLRTYATSVLGVFEGRFTGVDFGRPATDVSPKDDYSDVKERGW
jgi:hypothetical protein